MTRTSPMPWWWSASPVAQPAGPPPRMATVRSCSGVMLLQRSALPTGSVRTLVVHRPGGNVILVLARQLAPHFKELGRVPAAADDRGVLDHEADLVPVG